MVTDEFLPLLGREGLDTRRFALLGWSMGGYGALLLASRLGTDRVAAVVAESPALWREPGETAPGAYDDAADFRAHTLFGRQHALAGIPLRVDCGTGDPFYPATRSYVAGLSPPPGGRLPAGWARPGLLAPDGAGAAGVRGAAPRATDLSATFPGHAPGATFPDAASCGVPRPARP